MVSWPSGVGTWEQGSGSSGLGFSVGFRGLGFRGSFGGSP